MENLFGGSERRAFIFKTLNNMVIFLLIIAILYLASINNNTKH
jgi:competence protein ComGC